MKTCGPIHYRPNLRSSVHVLSTCPGVNQDVREDPELDKKCKKNKTNIIRYNFDNGVVRKKKTKVTEAEEILYALRSYELVGFTEHWGEVANSGHYVAYQEMGKCTMYNDHNGVEDPEVTKISAGEMAKAREEGYIYLYRRKR